MAIIIEHGTPPIIEHLIWGGGTFYDRWGYPGTSFAISRNNSETFITLHMLCITSDYIYSQIGSRNYNITDFNIYDVSRYLYTNNNINGVFVHYDEPIFPIRCTQDEIDYLTDIIPESWYNLLFSDYPIEGGYWIYKLPIR